MNGTLEYSDDAFADISVMFFADRAKPTPWRERLESARLDFSVQSLDHLNEYLDFVRKHEEVESVWNIICLRAGAYLGEVIRRNGYSDRWHWLDYDNALNVDTPTFTRFGKSIATCAVLYQGGQSFCFPLAKIAKYLENGSEDNTRFFAEVILDKWKQTESL